jgi:lipoate-protein ligase A
VFIDAGNLIVSLALPVSGIGESHAHFRCISRWLINGLDKIGFSGIEQSGISDLVLGDRKIAGACIYRSRNLLFYSASILVAPRIDLMERYLKHPPREPLYRHGRKHSQFVGRLLESISDDQIVDIARQLEGQLLLENDLHMYQPGADLRTGGGGPADQREDDSQYPQKST